MKVLSVVNWDLFHNSVLFPSSIVRYINGLIKGEILVNIFSI